MKTNNLAEQALDKPDLFSFIADIQKQAAVETIIEILIKNKLTTEKEFNTLLKTKSQDVYKNSMKLSNDMRDIANQRTKKEAKAYVG